MTAPLVAELVPAPDPARACEALEGLPYRLFLDSATAGTRLGQYPFLCADPVAVIRSKGDRAEWLSRSGQATLIQGSPIDALRQHMAAYITPPLEGLPPFQGGVAGYIGYEFGRTLEVLPTARHDDLAIPDLVLGIYDWVIAWEHASGRAWLVSTGMPETAGDATPERASERIAEVRAYLAGHRPAGGTKVPPYEGTVVPPYEGTVVPPYEGTVVPLYEGTAVPPHVERAPSYPVDERRLARINGLRSSFTSDDYIRAVATVREYIAAGDIFQANLSQRFEAPLVDSPWSLYTRLRTRNASPFAAFLDFPEATILSASPERFLRVAPDGSVETRPIKGTRPRGVGPEHDAHLGRELTESEKDQAENLMIVDLMRNDLSRVCRPGSVHVSELFALEHYATVHHLVSTVVGRLEPGVDALAMLLAAFPGGSVTGAPKIRAMEIIAELEPSARGVYCGAIGYWSRSGALDTNIAIRTAVARAGRITFSAGGGITFNSDPTQEYRETLDKARGMIDTLTAADVLILDNRDSFVYNLARYVRELGEDATVRRSDRMTVPDVEALAPSHIILSPGPCTPAEAGISTAVIRRFGKRVPILGVCLGHQCIGEAYGARVVRASRPVHGRTSRIVHDGTGIFASLPSPLQGTRYHSLVIDRSSLPDDLRVIASSADDNEIMAITHVRHPVVGVQFHPESAASECGYALVDAFLHGRVDARLLTSADAVGRALSGSPASRT